MRHRSTPDERLVSVHQFAERHGLNAMHFKGQQHVAARGGGNIFKTKHGWNARAVDVAVKQTNLGAESCEPNGQIRTHGALANSTLASAHRNDVLHQRQGIATLAGSVIGLANIGGELNLQFAERLAGFNGFRAHCLVDIAADLVLHGAGGGSELNDELDIIPRLQHVLDHAQGDQVLAKVGVLDRAEGVMEMLRRECHSPAIVSRTGYWAGFCMELLPGTNIIRRNLQ